MGIAEMTLTPEKLDEIERLAELATPGPWYYAGCNTVHDADHDEVAHPCDMGNDCATARYIASLDPATVRELVRLARIGERHETRPDPLGDAMDSGDGVYRP